VNKTADSSLVEAIGAYDYPFLTYDFIEDSVREFHDKFEFERFLKNLLTASDTQAVKDGLSGVLYWGYCRQPQRAKSRVNRFRDEVSDAQLRTASELLPTLEGTELMRLKHIGLPEFSNMAFITKLRTFLDPEHYCVLDKKIASLAPLARMLKRQKTYIPITLENERIYGWWVDICSSLASRLPIKARALDVERGLFHLVDHKQPGVAEGFLNSVAQPWTWGSGGHTEV
jgi:hypothetical protein